MERLGGEHGLHSVPGARLALREPDGGRYPALAPPPAAMSCRLLAVLALTLGASVNAQPALQPFGSAEALAGFGAELLEQERQR